MKASGNGTERGGPTRTRPSASVLVLGSDTTRIRRARAHHLDGKTWTNVDLPRNESLHAVYAVSATETYAAGMSRDVLVWNGSTWRVVTVPDAPGCNGNYQSVYS